MAGKPTRVAVLDYGMGNLHSVVKALEHVGAEVVLTSDPSAIDAADKLLFPGVGAMRDCMAGMKLAGIDTAVKAAVFNKPVMAICVGMQALVTKAEENGGVDCLGVLSGTVKAFEPEWLDEAGAPIKVPHMGWNETHFSEPDHALWQGIEDGSRFYYVHSYFVEPMDTSLEFAYCNYGKRFCASLIKDNLFATQFHPEKSHTAGLQLLKNFVEWKI